MGWTLSTLCSDWGPRAEVTWVAWGAEMGTKVGRGIIGWLCIF